MCVYIGQYIHALLSLSLIPGSPKKLDVAMHHTHAVDIANGGGHLLHEHCDAGLDMVSDPEINCQKKTNDTK